MYDVILFGGTTEGRQLAQMLCELKIPSVVSVATGYGSGLLSLKPPVKVHTGRMDESAMKALLLRERPKLVLDATHPYAEAVSKNIRSAADFSGCRYVRIRRESVETDGCICFDTMGELTDWLNQTEGRIFSTLGAKEAPDLCRVEDYRERVFLRLLPSADGIEECIRLGYPAKHLSCMQGPFSEAFNRAQFMEVGANILITKESGKQGGFEEKVAAAKECKMLIAVLKRPEQAQGITLEQAIQLIRENCL